ncbi:MAG TPA: sugar ABC transporter permease [Anaerolineae bacterium]|nr:sugar ABC transporter permease [Anaerolineae bacterium]
MATFKLSHISRDKLVLASFILPALAIFVVFKLALVPYALYMSCTDMAFLGEKAVNWGFIGLDNYFKVVTDLKFLESIKNSLIYTLVCAMLGQFWLGFFIAVLLSSKIMRNSKVKTVLIIVAIASWILPETVASFEWFALYDRRYGLINATLKSLGANPITWLDVRHGAVPGIPYALLSLIIANIWKGSTFSMINFSSAIETIPEDLYEAAEIDGASGWQKFRYITLPMVKRFMPLILIVLFMGSFTHFTFVFILTGGMWHEANVAIYSWATAFKYYEIGYGCAMSMIVVTIYIMTGQLQQRFTRG